MAGTTFPSAVYLIDMSNCRLSVENAATPVHKHEENTSLLVVGIERAMNLEKLSTQITCGNAITCLCVNEVVMLHLFYFSPHKDYKKKFKIFVGRKITQPPNCSVCMCVLSDNIWLVVVPGGFCSPVGVHISEPVEHIQGDTVSMCCQYVYTLSRQTKIFGYEGQVEHLTLTSVTNTSYLHDEPTIEGDGTSPLEFHLIYSRQSSTFRNNSTFGQP